MEWMLQVVDEIDDVIGAARMCYVGIYAEIGLLIAGCLGLGGIGVAMQVGAQLSLICSATSMLGIAAILKIHGSQFQASR